MQTLESERCHCGLPIYICHSDDPHIRMRIEEDTCEATKAVDVFEAAQRKKDGYEKPPGTTLRPVPYTTDDSDFVSYRDRFYDSENERRTEIMDSLRVS